MGIGAVVSAWALIETLLQGILCALAKADPTLGQALTEDLGPDNRLKAARRLVASWETVFREKLADELRNDLQRVREVCTWISQNKERRNRIAHWNWMRASDERLFGFKYHLKPGAALGPDGGKHLHMELATEDLMRFAGEISDQATMMLELQGALAKLPAWPKM